MSPASSLNSFRSWPTQNRARRPVRTTDAHVGCPSLLERGAKPGLHRGVEGVQDVGAVQRDREHAAVLLVSTSATRKTLLPLLA